jgi:hypothetical protein
MVRQVKWCRIGDKCKDTSNAAESVRFRDRPLALRKIHSTALLANANFFSQSETTALRIALATSPIVIRCPHAGRKGNL